MLCSNVWIVWTTDCNCSPDCNWDYVGVMLCSNVWIVWTTDCNCSPDCNWDYVGRRRDGVPSVARYIDIRPFNKKYV